MQVNTKAIVDDLKYIQVKNVIYEATILKFAIQKYRKKQGDIGKNESKIPSRN